MNQKINDCVFFLLSFLLIFNNVPSFIKSKYVIGLFSGHLIVYPLTFGIVYTLYYQYRYRNVFRSFGCFSKFFALYIGIYSVSTLCGLYIYQYYDVAMNTPIEQVPKLANVFSIMNKLGINIDEKFMLNFWIIVKPFKMIFIDSIYTFGGAYIIYCWYYNNWERAINIMTKGALAGLTVIVAYSTIEVFYLAGDITAKNILEFITPYFHPINNAYGWWPPLLWKGQLRSVFSEPSNVGNYIAFVMPVLWYLFLRDGRRLMFCLSAVLMFFVFLSNARTAYAMLFGMLVLLPMLLIYARRVDLLKKTIGIFLSCVVAFGIYIVFPNNEVVTNNTTVPDNIAISSLEKNFLSLASSNQRSNGARYGLIKSNLRIAMDYPILGVGTGLTSAYIVDYYTDEEKSNNEISLWVNSQKEKGVLSTSSSMNEALNEYITRLVQNGIMGLGVFLYPFAFAIIKLFKLAKIYEARKQLDVLMILLTLISSMVAGLNGTISVFFSSWIILGIAFDIIYSEKYCLITDEEREN